MAPAADPHQIKAPACHVLLRQEEVVVVIAERANRERSATACQQPVGTGIKAHGDGLCQCDRQLLTSLADIHKQPRRDLQETSSPDQLRHPGPVVTGVLLEIIVRLKFFQQGEKPLSGFLQPGFP